MLREILNKLREEFWLLEDNPDIPKSDIVEVTNAQDDKDNSDNECASVSLTKRKASSPLENAKKNTKWT